MARAAAQIAPGRQSMDDPFMWGTGKLPIVLTPESPDDTWRAWNLDAQTLATFTPDRLLVLLADISPEVSLGVFNALRFCDPGQTIEALRPGTEEKDPAAQAALDAILTKLDDLYVTRDVVWIRQFLSAFMRGGIISEAVLEEDTRTFADLAVPDPATLRFKRYVDPIRGQVWAVGQWQGGQWTEFTRPTIGYVPIDPMPGKPYGRPLMAPALFLSIFLLALLHDIRRVVQMQGYSRADILIDLKKLRESMPNLQVATLDEWAAWTDSAIQQVKSMWRTLEPDDAFIHTDVTTIQLAKGALSGDFTGSIDGLIKAIERGLTRALKSAPILMAITEGATEANANRQWEAHIAGIKALQHYVESLNERLLGLMLRAQGIQATVRFRFAELRASEILYDEQAYTLRLKNAFTAWAQGYVSQDEAANYAVGHPADQEEPRLIPSNEVDPNAPAPTGGNPPDPSTQPTDKNPTGKSGPAGFWRWWRESANGNGHERGTEDKVTPKGADKGLPAVPPRVEVTEADRRAMLSTWDAAEPEYAGILDASVTD